MNKITFGVMSYSFHGLKNVGAMDIYGYLETVKYRYGLDTADIWNGFIPAYDDDTLDKICSALEERELTLVNLCCDMAHLWDDDESVRASNEKMAKNCLKFAEKAGAKTIRMDVGVRDETFTDEKLDYVVRKYTEYCKIAESFGARLGPENHWGCSRDPESLQKLFDAVDAKNFGLLLHLGGWHSGASKENDLNFVKYAMHMHIPFEQAIGNDEHLLALKDAGYAGCWSAECHLATNEYRSVQHQLASIKRVLNPAKYSSPGEIMAKAKTDPQIAEKLKSIFGDMSM